MLPATLYSPIIPRWVWCRGWDAMMDPHPSACGACDLLRSFWGNAFNGKRVTPVSLIEQFLCQQQFLRAHETSFLPGL